MRRRAFARTESQRVDLELEGFNTLYDAGELADFIRDARPGAVLGIPALETLADPKLKTLARRRELWRVLDELPRGVILQDLKGRRTDTHGIEMVKDAIEIIMQSRKAAAARRNGKKSKGRPPLKIREQAEAVKPIWHSRKYATAASAVEHMPEGWSVARAYRLLGPRG